MKIISNEWFTGIGIAVIAGLILYFILRIIKPKRKQHSDTPTTINQNNIQQKDVQTILPSVSIGNANKNIFVNQNIQQNSLATSPQPIEASKMNISPKEIFQYLDDLPPFEQDVARHNYEGIKVSWPVKFQNALTVSSNLHITLSYGDSMYACITCQVDLSKYPQFKIMKKGHPMNVEGTISDIHFGLITLKDCTFII